MFVWMSSWIFLKHYGQMDLLHPIGFLGAKTYKVYVVFFLILVFYTSFSIIFGILEGLFQVFWYPTSPPGRPCIEFQELLEIF